MEEFKKRIPILYSSGQSMAEIAEELTCSVHKVVYWMNKLGISRRSYSDASYLKANRLGDPFSIKQNLDSSDIFLFGVGLGIYWGEGEKVSRGAVRVANSDPQVILKFQEFLINICQVNPEKIHYSLVCFNDTNPNKAVLYWSKILKTSSKNFGKIVTIPPQGKGTYKRKSVFGVCTITVSNVKLKRWVLDEIEKLKIKADIV